MIVSHLAGFGELCVKKSRSKEVGPLVLLFVFFLGETPASLKFHFPCLEISLFGFHFILSQPALDQLFNGPLLLGSVCRTNLLLNYLCCCVISLKIQEMGYISRSSLPNILSHSCLTNSMRWWGHIKTFLTGLF